MGSTRDTLVTLFEDIILASERLGTTSDPTETLVIDFIDRAILDITLQLEPQELLDSTATTANIVAAANTVSLPATLIKPTDVYYKATSGTYFEVFPRNLKSLIDGVGANNFFDASRTGRPTNYSLRGDALVFDNHFDRSAASAIAMFGLKAPTVLGDGTDATTTELSKEYDLLIIYKAAVFFFEREEDTQMIANYNALARAEEDKLKVKLTTRSKFGRIEMDPRFFSSSNNSGLNNPNVLF